MSQPRRSHTDARLLVLDDNPVNVELLLDLLEDHGYRNVQGLNDPRRLLPLLEEQGLPELILLDIRMPHLDGHRVLELLRERWGEQAPPVVVLSAQTDRETRLQALALGARDFLAKPFDQHEVLQRIHNVLELQRLLGERRDQALLLQNLVNERTAQIQRLSLQDPATELPNRHALLAELEEASRAGQELTLCYLTLNGFGEISRLHGYALGDALSRQLRDRLLGVLGTRGSLAIWKSAAWVVRLPSCAPELLAELLPVIVDCVCQPFHLDHLHLQLGVRIGVSHSRMAHHSAEHLLRLAAMAVPEENGRWQLYRSELEEELHRRTRYRQALHEALERDQMFLVYQPKVELHSGRVVGAEALLRWVHPELGFVSPAEFIPLAEASGEILRLGDWVLDRTIRQLESWFASGSMPRDFSLAVNVATLQLMQPDFAERLLARLQRSALPPGAVEVEVTESGLMQDVEQARRQLQALASQGIRIAIDDFGTGYSSLAYLKTLPVSVLKIDRAFVNDIDNNLQDLRLAETVVQMARNFGFTTVAEGVERAEHTGRLLEIGCQLGQGYWYSPPLRAEALVDFQRRCAIPPEPRHGPRRAALRLYSRAFTQASEQVIS